MSVGLRDPAQLKRAYVELAKLYHQLLVGSALFTSVQATVAALGAQLIMAYPEAAREAIEELTTDAGLAG